MDNQYYYLEREDLISFIHPIKGINPLINKDKFKDISLPTGRLSGNIVEKLFCNTRQLVFEVTRDCNLSCKYCCNGEMYNPYTNNFTEKDLSFHKAKLMIDLLANYRKSKNYSNLKRSIVLSFYGGEPLLRFDLICEIIKYAETKFENIEYYMTTNGVLLLKHIKYLIDKKFNLTVSLDGNKSNNGYRLLNSGKESFSYIYNNLKQIKKEYPSYFKKNILFNTVSHNLNPLEDIVSFFKEEFDKLPLVNALNNNNIREEKKSEFKVMNSKPQETKDIRVTIGDTKKIDPIRQNISSFTRSFSDNLFTTYKDLFTSPQKNKTFIPTGTCLPFSRKVFLTTDGNIYPCERIQTNYPLGFVDENSVKIDFNKVAKFYNDIYDQYINQCKSCYNKRKCTSCLYNDMDIEGKIQCRSYKSETEHNKWIQSQMHYLEEHPHYCVDTLKNSIFI